MPPRPTTLQRVQAYKHTDMGPQASALERPAARLGRRKTEPSRNPRCKTCCDGKPGLVRRWHPRGVKQHPEAESQHASATGHASQEGVQLQERHAPGGLSVSLSVKPLLVQVHQHTGAGRSRNQRAAKHPQEPCAARQGGDRHAPPCPPHVCNLRPASGELLPLSHRKPLTLNEGERHRATASCDQWCRATWHGIGGPRWSQVAEGG